MRMTGRAFGALSLGAALARGETPKRRWDVYVVQRSYTDLGFTERQEIVADYHAQLVRQAIGLARFPRQKDRPPSRQFKYTFECFWQIEQFLTTATAKDRDAVVEGIRSGSLELSASYLNLLDLADQKEYPFGKLTVLFFWEAPSRKRLLVWNGLAYHKANLHCYFVLSGAAQVSPKAGIAWVTLDAPLIQIGALRLWRFTTSTTGGTGPLYSWITNTKWQINTRYRVGDSYEMRYRIQAGSDLQDDAAAIERCRQISSSMIEMRQ